MDQQETLSNLVEKKPKPQQPLQLLKSFSYTDKAATHKIKSNVLKKKDKVNYTIKI